MRLVDFLGPKLHGLEKAERAGRPQARPGEFAGHVLRGFSMARAPRVASLEPVVGEKRDVRPPMRTIRFAGSPGDESRGHDRSGDHGTFCR